jgi:hypothetical protein
LSSASHTTSFGGAVAVADAVAVTDAEAVAVAEAVVVGFFDGGGADSPHATRTKTETSALFMPWSSLMAEGFLTC